MKPKLQTLEQQLERATASQSQPNVPLAPEAVPLHEAWLALGQLLEAAGHSADQPVAVLVGPPPRERRRWILAAVIGLAASLAAVATIVGTMRGIVTAWTARPAESSPPATATASESPGEGRGAVIARQQQAPVVSRRQGLAWEDTLDEEIALAGQEVIRVGQDSPRVAETSNPVRYGLERIERDIRSNSL